MKIEKVTKIGILFMVFLTLISLGQAAILCDWNGYAFITNSSEIPNGTLIAGYINGTQVANFTYNSGIAGYSLIYISISDNETINFKINGRNANEISDFNACNSTDPLMLVILNLTIDSLGPIDNDYDGYNDTYDNGSVWDCNDALNTTYPGAPEICGDGIVNNCNVVNKTEKQVCDFDEDNYCASSLTINTWDNLASVCNMTNTTDASTITATKDCDDNYNLTNPSQIEITYNGIDDDCNAATLDDDLDGDGFIKGPTPNLDCDDNDGLIYPKSTKKSDACGVDANCDGRAGSCSSGSSGGGCTSAYTNCTAWTECSVAGTQTRDCTDARRCTTSVKTETQTCTYVAPVVEAPPVENTVTPDTTTPVSQGSQSPDTTANTTDTGVNVAQGTDTTTTTTTGSGNALTGQVIAGQGFKPTWWMSLLALFVVIGILVGGYFFYKGRKDNEVIILK